MKQKAYEIVYDDGFNSMQPDIFHKVKQISYSTFDIKWLIRRLILQTKMYIEHINAGNVFTCNISYKSPCLHFICRTENQSDRGYTLY